MGYKPPGYESDIIKLELRDLLASVGELRIAVGALTERVERLERRPSVGIEGLENMTVTPPPEFSP